MVVGTLWNHCRYIFLASRVGARLIHIAEDMAWPDADADIWQLFAQDHFVALPSRLRNGSWGFAVWLCVTPEEEEAAQARAVAAERDFVRHRGSGFWVRIRSAGGRRGGLPSRLRSQRLEYVESLRLRPAEIGTHPEWALVDALIEAAWAEWAARHASDE